MKKLCFVFLAVLLLALHVTSQVTQTPYTKPTSTGSTQPGNGCGSPGAFALLFAPLMLSTLLLHGWSG